MLPQTVPLRVGELVALGENADKLPLSDSVFSDIGKVSFQMSVTPPPNPTTASQKVGFNSPL